MEIGCQNGKLKDAEMNDIFFSKLRNWKFYTLIKIQ
jgi:hypothetical protein